jgi:hypothetical protein
MNQDRASMHTLKAVVTNKVGKTTEHTSAVVVTNPVSADMQQEETVIVERQMRMMKMTRCRGRWKKRIQKVIVLIQMTPVIQMKKRTEMMPPLGYFTFRLPGRGCERATIVTSTRGHIIHLPWF